MLAKTELDTAHAICRDAADWIEKYGWRQRGSGCGPNNERCAMQAIWEVAAQRLSNKHDLQAVSLLYGEATIVIANYLKLPTRNGGASVIRWNDTEGRTEGEVIEALRSAAYAG